MRLVHPGTAVRSALRSGAARQGTGDVGGGRRGGVVGGVLADGGWKYLSASFWDRNGEDAELDRTIWW